MLWGSHVHTPPLPQMCPPHGWAHLSILKLNNQLQVLDWLKVGWIWCSALRWMPQPGDQPAGLGHCVLPLWRTLTKSGTGAFLCDTGSLHMLGWFYWFLLLPVSLSYFAPLSFLFLLASIFSGMVTCDYHYRDSKAAIRSWIMGL